MAYAHIHTASPSDAICILANPDKMQCGAPVYFRLQDDAISKLRVLVISFQASAAAVIRRYNSFQNKAEAYVAN